MKKENKKDFISFLTDALSDKPLLFGIAKIDDKKALKEYFDKGGYVDIEKDDLARIFNLFKTVRSRVAQMTGADDYY